MESCFLRFSFSVASISFGKNLFRLDKTFACTTMAPIFYGFPIKPVSVFCFVFYYIYIGYFYAFRPGTCGYDTVIQILDLVTGMDPLPFDWLPWQENVSALMNDHHPVFTTLIFTFFYRIGVLLGNPNYGMLFYCLLQIAGYALLFGHVICLMDRLGVPKLFALLSSVHRWLLFTALL